MVKPPLPFILLASMNSTSPPAGVQARPTATPGRLVRSAISPIGADLDAAQKSSSAPVPCVTTSFSVLPSAMRRACLRQMVPIVAFQVAHARFARVVPDDEAHRFFRKFDLLRR